MIRLSDRVESSRGRLEVSWYVPWSSSSVVLKPSWSKPSGPSGVPKYPLSRNAFLFRSPLASCDGGGVSMDGGRIGDSCRRRGGATTIEGLGGSISKTGNLELLEFLRDRRPLSLL